MSTTNKKDGSTEVGSRPQAALAMAGRSLSIGLVASGTLAFWSHQSFAAGSAPAPYDPFNTFSFGVGGGWDVFNSSADVYSSTPSVPLSEHSGDFGGFDGRLQGAGGFGTIEVGRDIRLGQGVFGLYGDAAFGRKQDVIGHIFGGGSVTEAGLRLTNSYALVGRAGFLANPSALFYGLVGYTWQNYHAWGSVYDNYLDQTLNVTKSGNIGGLTVGLGTEVMVGANWSLKGEYRFVKLGTVGEFQSESSENSAFFHADIGKVSDHVFRLVASYKVP